MLIYIGIVFYLHPTLHKCMSFFIYLYAAPATSDITAAFAVQLRDSSPA
jgi:hypothetical protein